MKLIDDVNRSIVFWHTFDKFDTLLCWIRLPLQGIENAAYTDTMSTVSRDHGAAEITSYGFSISCQVGLFIYAEKCLYLAKRPKLAWTQSSCGCTTCLGGGGLSMLILSSLWSMVLQPHNISRYALILDRSIRKYQLLSCWRQEEEQKKVQIGIHNNWIINISATK